MDNIVTLINCYTDVQNTYLKMHLYNICGEN